MHKIGCFHIRDYVYRVDQGWTQIAEFIENKKNRNLIYLTRYFLLTYLFKI